MSVPNIKRNLEVGTIYVPLWHTGLYTQRNPMYTPISAMGVQMISRYDTLWDGQNIEVSLANTLVRRPGFYQFTTLPFGGADYPLAFYSFKDSSGNVFPIVDTPSTVYLFSATTLSSLFNKATNAGQMAFKKVGNIVYMSDGIEFVQWSGTLGDPPIDVGIAKITAAPTVTTKAGNLLPTAGWSYGYSFANSTTGAVSTMSPATASVGTLDLQQVVETLSTANITGIDSVVSGDGPGTCTWTCVNNFAAGQTISVSGSSPYLVSNMKTFYTIESTDGASFTTSTAPWGPPYHGTPGEGFGQNAVFTDVNVTNAFATLSPITIPPSPGPYTYTVLNAGPSFSAANLFGGDKPAVVKSGSTTFTQVATSGDVVSTGQFFCDSNGDFTFDSADHGKAITITYQIVPSGGATSVAFTITGPSNGAVFQQDTTGFEGVDSAVIYRTNDGDSAGGPWFFLAQVPLDVNIILVTPSGSTTIYTFDQSIPAGLNNGFATATGAQCAQMEGFTNIGNGGFYDIVASTDTTITCNNPFGVSEIPLPSSAFVNPKSWRYTDTGSVFDVTLDPSNQDEELDILIEAPIDDANDPPPASISPGKGIGKRGAIFPGTKTGTFTALEYHAGRLWGALANLVYFAGGPDVTFGSPEDSWPPANVFTFPGTVTALISTNAGLVVFTDADMFIIYGTATANFYSNVFQKNFGTASQNCVKQDGDNLFVYTTKQQLFHFGTELTEIGYNIGDQLKANFPPSTSYIALHRNGSDTGLFISNGTDQMFKYRMDQQSWSTVLEVVGGAGAIDSIETTLDEYTLCSGISGNSFIIARDETATIFQDSGTSYPADAVVGSLVLSPPGNSSIIESVLLEYMPLGSEATVSVLLQEISGIFIPLSNPVPDPPGLPLSTSVISQRFYLRSASTPLPQQVRHLMVKISFPPEDFRNEILTLGLS